MGANRIFTGLLMAMGLVAITLGGGCTPMIAGQMAEGSYTAAKSALGALNPTTTGGDERQRNIQATLNEVDVGDEILPVLEKIGEPPRVKSGNAQGYTCYEFPSVYSSAEAAVLMSHEGRIVFYGNSRCTQEMDAANFRGGGKYSGGGGTKTFN